MTHEQFNAQRKRCLVNRDQLMNADKVTVARATVRVLDALQHFYKRKSEQVMALAAAFVLLTEATGVEPYEAYTAVKNLMVDDQHSDQRDHRFAAVKYHIENEVLYDGTA